ncbi:hypothetical protein SRABI128_06571 [Microbacterium sp. Bi128]|nr:hypothetical protein SRABI128_06571 [Microbacterium sp. Bi128]
MPTGEGIDALVDLVRQIDLGDDLIDPFVALCGASVWGQAQLSGEMERAADSELPVEDVLLGNQAHQEPELGVLGVEVPPVPADVPASGRAQPGKGAQEGGFASAGRPYDRHERPGRDGDGHIVHQVGASLGGDLQVPGAERGTLRWRHGRGGAVPE